MENLDELNIVKLFCSLPELNQVGHTTISLFLSSSSSSSVSYSAVLRLILNTR